MSTAHERAQITSVCGTLAGVSALSYLEQRKDCSKPTLRRDKDDVHRLISTMQTVAANPVASSNELLNVVTGVVASSKVRHDLEKAYYLGDQAMKKLSKNVLFLAQYRVILR